MSDLAEYDVTITPKNREHGWESGTSSATTWQLGYEIARAVQRSELGDGIDCKVGVGVTFTVPEDGVDWRKPEKV